jgi:pre-peptidase
MKRLLYVCGFALLAAGPAGAQAPTITGVFPAGGQVGATVETTVSGANLADSRQILVSGSGVKVEKGMGGDASNLPVRLSIAPDAEIGVRELRIVTSRGGSNAGRIWVGNYPSVLEKEPNNTVSQPQPVEKTPVTIDGRAERGEDVDHYTFQAGAGETWVFSINAARHLSNLDGFLTLRDGRGRVLRSAIDNFERDPRLIHTFKTGGKYFLEVRDTMYRGGSGFTYRITLGKLPVVTRWSPMGGARGATVPVTLRGVNLGQMEQGQVQVALQAEPGEDRVRFVPKTPLGPANPIVLFLSDAREVVEQEPNDAVPAATPAAAFPVVAGGWIDKQGDRDVFKFGAKEKQAVFLDVQARRLGSRLDPVMRILDASGKELANNDDAVGRDSRLTFTAPAAGDYFVEVRSLSGRGGDDYFYRLEMGEPPPPDFTLRFTPDNPTVPAGAAVAVTVTAQRQAYGGEIALRVENLPPGVTASPAVLRQGQNSTVFTLTAPAGTAPAASMLKVVGAAKIGDRNVERVAAGQERYQPPLTNNAQQARMRDTEMILSAVGPEAPYTLAVTAPAMEVKAGQKLELTVTVNRKADFKENVAVTVLGLPPNVKAGNLTINKDKTEGKLTLEAAGNAPPGPATIVVQGNGKNVIVAAPAVSLTVQPK